MSSITRRVIARFDRWIERIILADERYVCGACDDRFTDRALGVEHVLHCHPEYRGVVVYEGAAAQPRPAAAPSRPAWAPIPSGLKPVPVHARTF